MSVKTLVLAALLACACGSTLPTQKRLGGYVSDAKRACKTDGRRCQAAKLCAHAAVGAAQAIQAQRRAVAEGRDDAEATLQAASLPVAAEAQCRALGFKPAEVTP